MSSTSPQDGSDLNQTRQGDGLTEPNAQEGITQAEQDGWGKSAWQEEHQAHLSEHQQYDAQAKQAALAGDTDQQLEFETLAALAMDRAQMAKAKGTEPESPEGKGSPAPESGQDLPRTAAAQSDSASEQGKQPENEAREVLAAHYDYAQQKNFLEQNPVASAPEGGNLLEVRQNLSEKDTDQQTRRNVFQAAADSGLPATLNEKHDLHLTDAQQAQTAGNQKDELQSRQYAQDAQIKSAVETRGQESLKQSVDELAKAQVTGDSGEMARKAAIAAAIQAANSIHNEIPTHAYSYSQAMSFLDQANKSLANSLGNLSAQYAIDGALSRLDRHETFRNYSQNYGFNNMTARSYGFRNGLSSAGFFMNLQMDAGAVEEEYLRKQMHQHT